jgi:hypothetical protein
MKDFTLEKDQIKENECFKRCIKTLGNVSRDIQKHYTRAVQFYVNRFNATAKHKFRVRVRDVSTQNNQFVEGSDARYQPNSLSESQAFAPVYEDWEHLTHEESKLFNLELWEKVVGRKSVKVQTDTEWICLGFGDRTRTGKYKLPMLEYTVGIHGDLYLNPEKMLSYWKVSEEKKNN